MTPKIESFWISLNERAGKNILYKGFSLEHHIGQDSHFLEGGLLGKVMDL